MRKRLSQFGRAIDERKPKTFRHCELNYEFGTTTQLHFLTPRFEILPFFKEMGTHRITESSWNLNTS